MKLDLSFACIFFYKYLIEIVYQGDASKLNYSELANYYSIDDDIKSLNKIIGNTMRQVEEFLRSDRNDFSNTDIKGDLRLIASFCKKEGVSLDALLFPEDLGYDPLDILRKDWKVSDFPKSFLCRISNSTERVKSTDPFIEACYPKYYGYLKSTNSNDIDTYELDFCTDGEYVNARFTLTATNNHGDRKNHPTITKRLTGPVLAIGKERMIYIFLQNEDAKSSEVKDDLFIISFEDHTGSMQTTNKMEYACCGILTYHRHPSMRWTEFQKSIIFFNKLSEKAVEAVEAYQKMYSDNDVFYIRKNDFEKVCYELDLDSYVRGGNAVNSITSEASTFFAISPKNIDNILTEQLNTYDNRAKIIVSLLKYSACPSKIDVINNDQINYYISRLIDEKTSNDANPDK